MRKYINPLMIAAAMATSVNVLAVQKDITVNASVDPELDITQADNTPLPASIDMQYLPGRGLESYRVNTKIWSNSAASNVKARLVSAAKLSNSEGAESVPLTVRLGDKTLTTADVEFTGTELFPGNIENGSAVLPMTISQTTKGALKTGQYSGVVSLMLTQATTTPDPESGK
ncbi:Colonization factor antigen I subunit B [Cedecea lapagei]|uniref:Colonization factor antigen I subunit B n=1 Tax=Cedecea lapagei TaxID=158823 RepID=A0A447V475_9ENTR|nr:CS1 type fimbrial major subunit [Cedecea lapagei]VEB99022.1 Colonization factor antigen I subunit B [Cedecea lapagei]